MLIVKLNRTDVIKVTEKSEKTPKQFVVSNFDSVIITSGYEERLRPMKIHSPHMPLVFLKAIDECPHTVIPELDGAAVETCEDPWPLAVETQSLHPITLPLELFHIDENRDRIKEMKSIESLIIGEVRFGRGKSRRGIWGSRKTLDLRGR
ncbi:hypothetical protein Droror1_Dr00008919 [Drosera rotundifolia]